MRNAPYVQPRLASILELCWAFPIRVGLCSVIVAYPGHRHLLFC